MKRVQDLRVFGHMSRVTFYVVIVCCLASSSHGAVPNRAEAKKYLVAPTVLPNVRPEMNTSGFWIGRLSQPDKVILDADEIEAFNRDIQTRLGLTKDIAKFPEIYEGDTLRKVLQAELKRFQDRPLYGANGHHASRSFYTSIEKNMSLASIDSKIDVTFALVVRNADQRLLPSTEPLYAMAGDIDFDEVQNNALDLGTPVAILHRSADRQWCYTMGPSSDGWIRPEFLAVCSKGQLNDIVSRELVTIVRAKGNIYLDKALTQYHGFVRMGSRLFLADDVQGNVVSVLLPIRTDDGSLSIRTGYLKRRETVKGHLPYTPRHMIEQAFEMLDTPYGWGSMNGQQDCSGFVQAVFATVGIAMPRNSSEQARIGQLIGSFGKDDANERKRQVLVTQATAGTSCLFLNGHVMLYLGDVAGRPYVIHDTWAYPEPSDTLRVINRVAVTDLDLGQDSTGGSTLHRLIIVRTIE